MAKLHELIPVNNALEGQADKCAADLTELFTKKHHHFTEKLVTVTSKEETGAPPTVEEQLALQTTVQKELTWMRQYWVKAIDSAHQINVGNTLAKADIALENGETLASKVPATTLLELDKMLTKVKNVLSAIPTLDPAKSFKPDPSREPGVSIAREVTRTRTAKKQKGIVLYDATPEHPAQTQLITEDIPVATVTTQEWSGMITPGAKADLLDRCEILMRAVKAARARANEVEIDLAANRIASSLLDYVLGK
jgi:hypothetical protein